MKSKVKFLLLALFLVITQSLRAEVISGNITSTLSMSFDTSTGILAFEGTGVIDVGWEASVGYAPTTHSPLVKHVTIGEGITTINTDALCFSRLESASFPSTLTSVQSDALQGGDGFCCVEFPGGINPALFESTNLNGGSIYGAPEMLFTVAASQGVTDAQLLAVETNMNHTWHAVDAITHVTAQHYHYGSHKRNNTTVFYFAANGPIGSGMRVSDLRDVYICEGVTALSANAFSGAYKLRTMTLPASLTSIDVTAFKGCEQLTELTFRGEEAPAINGTGCLLAGASLAGTVTPASFIAPEHLPNTTYWNTGYTRLPDNRLACWKFIPNDPDDPASLGTLTIEGTGGTGSFTTNSFPWYSLRSRISTLQIGEGITTLGNRAFYDCSAISTILLPSTLTTIGTGTFTGIPTDGVVFVAPGCTADVAGALGDNWRVEEGVYGTYRYKTFHSGEKPLHLVECSGSYNFSSETGTLTIDAHGFIGPGYSESIHQDFPELTEADKAPWEAFKGQVRAIHFTETSDISWIFDHSFEDYPLLEEIIFPGDPLSTIDDYNFNFCPFLRHIVFTSHKAPFILGYAFMDPAEDGTIDYPSDGEGYNDYFFRSVPWYEDPELIPIDGSKIKWKYNAHLYTLDIAGYGEVPDIANAPWRIYRDDILYINIYDRVKSISPDCFADMPHLAEVSIGSYVKTIGARAFKGTSITGLYLSDGLESIGEEAFADCPKIVSLTVYPSLKKIGAGAFRNCKMLSYIVVKEGALPTIAADAFQGVADIGVVTASRFDNLPFGTLLPVWKRVANAEIDGLNGDAMLLWGKSDDGALCVFGVGTVYSHQDDDLRDWTRGGRYNAADFNAIVVAGNIKSISRNAFTDLPNVTDIYLPATLDLAHTGYAFRRLVRLQAFHVADDNPNLCVVNGAICRGGSLLRYPQGNPATSFMAHNIDRVEDYAFEDAINLREIYFDCLDVTDVSSFATLGMGDDVTVYYTGDHRYNNHTANHLLVSHVQEHHPTWNLVLMNRINDDFFWVLRGDELTMYGQGPMPDFNDVTYEEQLRFPPTVNPKSIVLAEGITTIGRSAFVTHADNLVSVQFPSTLKTIGANAFNGARRIEQLVLPDGLLTIEPKAFAYCAGLRNVTFPASLKTIGDEAFFKCTGLTNFSFKANPFDLTIGDYAFHYCEALPAVILPEGVKSLGTGAFAECAGLKSAIIPSTLNTISRRAFFMCERLADVQFPPTLDLTLGTEAFYDTKLQMITLPEGLETIGAKAFYHNIYLEKVVFPTSLKTIADSAFAACTHLSRLDFMSHAQPTLGKNVFVAVPNRGVVSLAAAMKEDYANVFAELPAGWSIRLPNSINGTNLTWAYNQHSKTVVIAGEGEMTTTFPWAEYSNEALHVRIYDNVQSVSANAFKGFTALLDVELPASLQSIGASAFAGCSQLADVTYNGTADVTFAATNAFQGVAELGALHLPNTTLSNVPNLKAAIPESWLFSSTNLDLQWAYDPTNKTLTVSGTGDIPAATTFPWANHSTEAQHIVIGKGVTSISANAFKGFTALLDVELPASLKTIGASAFAGCSQLADVTYNGTADVTSVGTNAFQGAAEWGVLHLPKTTLSNVPKLNAAIPQSWLFASTNLDLQWAYDSTSKTLTVSGTGDIPTATTTFPWANHSTEAQHIVIGKGVTSISANAFKGFTALLDVELPASLKTIGASAFAGCSQLADVTYHGTADVTSVGTNAFQGVAELGTLHLPNTTLNNVPKFKAAIPESWLFTSTNPDLQWAYDPTNKTLTVSGTGDIPTAATTFPWANHSTEAQHIVIGEGVTSISANAFKGFTALTDAHFPSTLKFIGASAFAGCSLLNYLQFDSNTRPSLQSTTFQDIAPEGTVVVQDWGPYLSIYIYLPSGWGGQKLSGTLEGTSVTWEYDIDNKILTLGGEGSIPDYFDETAPMYFYCRTLIIGWGIDEIGYNAINENNLQNVYDYAHKPHEWIKERDNIYYHCPEDCRDQFMHTVDIYYLFADIPVVDKPSVTFDGAKIRLACSTPNVEYHYSLKAVASTDSSAPLPNVYELRVFATAPDMAPSPDAVVTFNPADLNGDGVVTIGDLTKLIEIVNPN